MKSRRTLRWGAEEEIYPYQREKHILALMIHNWEGSQRLFFTPFPHVLYF